MKTTTTAGLIGAALVGGAGAFAALVGSGKLTLDTGWGRSVHQLGPVTWRIDAPRELVWQQFSATYQGSIPRDMREHLAVVERGSDLVVAWHRFDIGPFSSETVEAIGLEEPSRIRFRHLRGPVPHAVEEFRFEPIDEQTTLLTYEGELGFDGWRVGRAVLEKGIAPVWMKIIDDHVDSAAAAVTKRAEARRRRAAKQAASA